MCGSVIAATACLVALGIGWHAAATTDLRTLVQLRSSPPATGGPAGKPAVRSAATAPLPSVMIIPFGAPGDLPVVGRWTESPTTYIGLYRPSNSTFYLKIRNNTGPPDRVVTFGEPGDLPLAGRWCRGARSDAPAVYRPRVYSLIFRCGNEVSTVQFGAAGDVPVAGDWWGSGTSSIGVYRPSQNIFLLGRGRNIGATIPFGAAGDLPVVRHLPAGSVVGVHR